MARKPLNDWLLAQIELLDDRLVTLDGTILKVVEKTAARCNHLQKTATGRMILGVGLQVFCEGGDPLVRLATWTSALPVSFSCSRSAAISDVSVVVIFLEPFKLAPPPPNGKEFRLMPHSPGMNPKIIWNSGVKSVFVRL